MYKYIFGTCKIHSLTSFSHWVNRKGHSGGMKFPSKLALKKNQTVPIHIMSHQHRSSSSIHIFMYLLYAENLWT